jgi:DNA polymerase I-like protein with 3'-5' exonuclease and polymerase domains
MNKSYVKVNSLELVKEMAHHIASGDIIAVDTETTSLNPRKGEIIGVSVSSEIGKGYYLPTKVFANGELVDNQIEEKSAHELAKKILTLLIGKRLVFHNASFDIRFVFAYYGVDLLDSLHADTMLLMHTLNEEGAGFGSSSPFALKEIAKLFQEELGLDIEKEANEEQLELKTSIKDNGGSTSKENYEIWKADIDILTKYACADTDLTLRLYHLLDPMLDEQELRKFFYVDEVMPLYKEVTIPMETKGVCLDLKTIEEAKVNITKDLEIYRERVIKSLMSREEVKVWIILKATEKFPTNHKGAFAQELASHLSLDLPKSETSGRYSITVKTVASIQDEGIRAFFTFGDTTSIDEDLLTRISMKMWKEDNDGEYFNIQSKDHLGEIAFGAMGIKPLSFTKTGKPQFDDDLIDSIKDKHPWAKELRIYNRLMKIKSTYIDRFLDAQEDGKYYFSYKQHGTVSGRYGSDAQQLPRVKEEGDDDPTVIQYNNLIRAFFIPNPENLFIDDDYESLEPKTFAHVSDDEGLMDIFRNGWDFYSTIAIRTEKLTDYSPDKKAPNFLKKVAPAMRNKAKAYSLGVPYGMGGFALGKSINVSTKEGEKLVNDYLNSFPNLKLWMENSKAFVKENGYIRTQVGRIRHLSKVKKIYEAFEDGLLDFSFKRRLEKEYGKDKVTGLYKDYKNGINNSMNVQIQGLAASIVNRAAIAINRRLKSAGITGWVCAQIHDQIICEVEGSKAEEAAKIVQDCMENTIKLKIPLVAEPVIAHNWRDGH